MSKYKTEKSRDDTDNFSSLSERLVSDLRNQINEVSSLDVYSESWIDLTFIIERIANIVRAESAIEADEAELESKEAKASTLWESDEVALRILLEDGKANVLLRMLQSYKEAQHLAFPNADHPFNVEPRVRDAGVRYEAGLCTILHHGLMHSEISETVDLTVLLATIEGAFAFAVAHPEAFQHDIETSLEGAGFALLATVISHFEEQDAEARIIPIVLEHNLLALSMQHLLVNVDLLSSNDQDMALITVSHIVKTEDFGIREEKYLPSSTDEDNLLKLKPIAEQNISRTPELRRILRPLTDELSRRVRACKK